MGQSDPPNPDNDADSMWGLSPTGADEHINYNGWLRFNLDEEDIESSELGLLAQAGQFSALSAGLYWRKPLFVATESTQIGLQIDGGAAWLGAGVPMAFQLVDNFWVTLQPTVRGSYYSVIHLPVGVAYEVADLFRIDISGGIHSKVAPEYAFDSYMYYGAAAMAFQF